MRYNAYLLHNGPLNSFFDKFDAISRIMRPIMKSILFLLALMNCITPIFAQNEILRSYFTLPGKVQYRSFEVKEIDNINIDSDGIGNYWDFSSSKFEQTGGFVQFQKFVDTNPSYNENSFFVLSDESSGANIPFDLYSLTEDSLLLRGYGELDENGTPTYDLLDIPFVSMKFPWNIGDTIVYNNPPIRSIRSYSAKGFIKFPGQEATQAWKVKEEFYETDILVIQYFWYSSEIPYPMLSITKRLQASDSTLLYMSVQALIKQSMTGLTDNNQPKREIVKLLGNNRILLCDGLSIVKVLNVKGSELPYSNNHSGEYVLEGTIPNILFLVLKDSINNVSTHTLVNQ